MLTITLSLVESTAPAEEPYLCHCLRMTEANVVETIVTLGLRSFDELRRCTAAGDGCTACHARLRECIERHACPGSSSALPMFSVK
jgi:bacterioferritin-associated ferredoxin